MSSVVISGDTSGQVTLAAPAVAGSNTATLPVATGELSMLGTTGQTWQNVASSRVSGTTYTNTTGKPISVAITPNTTGSNTVITISSTTIFNAGNYGLAVLIPTGATYTITPGGGIFLWYELR